MNFNIFTMVWGKYHLAQFEDACFRSLNWPKNRASLEGKTWVVYTKKEDVPEIERIFSGTPYKLAISIIGESVRVAGCGFVPLTQCDGGVLLLQGFRDHIYYCLNNRQRMFLAPPDTIFSDGSVEQMLMAGVNPGSAVGVAHARVLPSFLEEIKYRSATAGSPSSRQMVDLTFKHLHDSWVYAEEGHIKNTSFIGGVLWKKTAPNLYRINHRLPTMYFIDFTKEDFDFFWSQVSFGGIDHRWPGEHLIRQERMRLLGSSDAAYIVELTEHDKNVPPEVPNLKLPQNEPDLYWNNHFHNSINRQFVTYFSGE